MAGDTKIVVLVSNEFNNAIEAYANEHGISSAELVRLVLAQHIKYDLQLERKNRVETRGRPKQFTELERKERDRLRKQAQRKLASEIWDDIQHNSAVASKLALQGTTEN